jgi:Mn-dependent DtxR family transcriptional regulator
MYIDIMNIYESAEDYLERILILQEEKGEVRSIDIAHDMGFSKPSISVAMKKLKEAGLINIDQHGFITLTKEGHVIADKVYERHKVLKKVLIDIGVDPKQAEKDACKVEHVISEETFEAIKKHIK